MKDLLLCVDIGNTNVVLGAYSGDELKFLARIASDTKKTGDQYAIELLDILRLYGTDAEDYYGAIIGSVVPVLSSALDYAIGKILGVKALKLGPGVKTGLNIKIDNPAETGSDLVAAAVGAKAKYTLPLIIIDMGTATTITAVDKDGAFRGGAIIPGLKVSLEALVGKTSMLTGIALSAPKKAIGTSTTECMQSGIIFGNACMIDGFIERFKEELDCECTVIGTGGLMNLIAPCCRSEIIVDDLILVEGLRIIYEKNQ